MIFIANALPVNGGTTFLIRACRELCRRGQKVVVLVLFPIVDAKLRVELERYALVCDLREYLWDRGLVMRAQLMTFAPVRWRTLIEVLRPFGSTVHVMGVFGLLFASRLARHQEGVCATVGVYHQNEYLFEVQRTFFVRIFRRCFEAVPARQFLFFNQASVSNYSRFFGTDYAAATIAPIGIDIGAAPTPDRPAQVHGKLVSVGNLVNFKTYNAQMIRIVATLAQRNAQLHYDIYGSGPEEQNLRNLAQSLGIQDRIRFHGPMAYADFSRTVGQAMLFIGSGTAVVEAAALAIPAMIGIESFKQAETYGFLSDIEGYSYNEYRPGVPLVPMQVLVERVLSDPGFAAEVGAACRAKAKEFSIEATVDAVTALTEGAMVRLPGLGARDCVRAGVSFIGVALLDVLRLSSTFRNRRDQSYGLT